MVNTDALILRFSEEEKQVLNAFASDNAFSRTDLVAWLQFYQQLNGEEFSFLYSSLLDTVSSLTDEEFSALGSVCPMPLGFVEGDDVPEEENVAS